ncbi:PEP-CTERM sorting domain-containing protein [Thalassomonas viridans]|uniref:PEP-CTERM sorting domain-containing protein n=1 Tax=Thalassomonas viridans TaxID=137584 RepID=A0AAF0C890_9GAMM|nr:PEP-CTERM sorting domain-containing protein [Thalassomonas viridans]WDE03629.1 PEP-CTERM sorting domain-containing protein [Thalassomonas viridans]
MMKFLKIALTTVSIAACSLSNMAHASIIDWSVDRSSNIVSYHGSDSNLSSLEWLRWDATDGMSINEAVDLYGADGWQVATSLETSYMLNDLFLTGQFNAEYEHIVTSNSLARSFGNLFGYTYSADYENDFYASYALHLYTDGTSVSTSRASDEYQIDANGSLRVAEVHAGGTTFGFTRDTKFDFYGIAMVRSTGQPATEVPEPSTLAIFALTLTALGFRRFKKQ